MLKSLLLSLLLMTSALSDLVFTSNFQGTTDDGLRNKWTTLVINGYPESTAGFAATELEFDPVNILCPIEVRLKHGWEQVGLDLHITTTTDPLQPLGVSGLYGLGSMLLIDYETPLSYDRLTERNMTFKLSNGFVGTCSGSLPIPEPITAPVLLFGGLCAFGVRRSLQCITQ